MSTNRESDPIKLFAHSFAGRPVDEWEPLSNHLSAVGDRAALFAAAFGWAEAARTAGHLHDIGKCSAAFQAYLRQPRAPDGPRVRGPDHSTAGALEAWRAYPKSRHLGRLLGALIAGHHGGLMDVADLGKAAGKPNPILRRVADGRSVAAGGRLPRGPADDGGGRGQGVRARLPHPHVVLVPGGRRLPGNRARRGRGREPPRAPWSPHVPRNPRRPAARPHGHLADARSLGGRCPARRGAGPLPRPRRVPARPVHAHGADRRRQDAGLAVLRAGARAAPRDDARGPCHPLHLDHRADRRRVPPRAWHRRRRAGAPRRLRLGTRGGGPPGRRRGAGRFGQAAAGGRELGRAGGGDHRRAVLREPVRGPHVVVPQAAQPRRRGDRAGRGADPAAAPAATLHGGVGPTGAQLRRQRGAVYRHPAGTEGAGRIQARLRHRGQPGIGARSAAVSIGRCAASRWSAWTAR